MNKHVDASIERFVKQLQGLAGELSCSLPGVSGVLGSMGAGVQMVLIETRRAEAQAVLSGESPIARAVNAMQRLKGEPLTTFAYESLKLNDEDVEHNSTPLLPETLIKLNHVRWLKKKGYFEGERTPFLERDELMFVAGQFDNGFETHRTKITINAHDDVRVSVECLFDGVTIDVKKLVGVQWLEAAVVRMCVDYQLPVLRQACTEYDLVILLEKYKTLTTRDAYTLHEVLEGGEGLPAVDVAYFGANEGNLVWGQLAPDYCKKFCIYSRYTTVRFGADLGWDDVHPFFVEYLRRKLEGEIKKLEASASGE